jgi:hypothetical protein
VLVVERLPVPLHVSFNCLRNSRAVGVPSFSYKESFSDSDSEGEDAPAAEQEQEPANSGVAYVTIEAEFEPASLPVE